MLKLVENFTLSATGMDNRLQGFKTSLLVHSKLQPVKPPIPNRHQSRLKFYRQYILGFIPELIISSTESEGIEYPNGSTV